MKNGKRQSSQWVNIPLTKNGQLRVSGRLLNISELKKPATNPNNAPRYKLIDIGGKEPTYLSGLYDNGDHFGGDIKVSGKKYRFKLRKAKKGFQESGLSEAVKRWVDSTQPQNTLDLDPLEPPKKANKEIKKEEVGKFEFEIKPVDVRLETLPEIDLGDLPEIDLGELDFNIELDTVDKMKE